MATNGKNGSSAVSLDVEMLFESVREPLAKRLSQWADECVAMHIVAGYVTVDGVRALPLQQLVEKLGILVIGAGTQRAFDAIDALLKEGLPRDRVAVHLGHTRLTRPSAKKRFYQYHPMLHSKIYLFEMPGSRAVAVVGSHNLTAFAMLGLNGEASIMLSGPSNHPELVKIRGHIEAARDEAQPYSSHLRDGYAWWTSQLMEGMAKGALDRPRDWRADATVILLTEGPTARPRKQQKLYFELPRVLKQRVLNAEVHLYIFDQLPPNPESALELRHSARSKWGRILGLEDDQGGLELDVDWHITTDARPSIKKAEKPFRPQPPTGYQQVRAELYHDVQGDPEYLFANPKSSWLPRTAADESIRVAPTEQKMLESMSLIPPQHLDWYKVTGLDPAGDKNSKKVQAALAERRPGGRSFVLISLWRSVGAKG